VAFKLRDKKMELFLFIFFGTIAIYIFISLNNSQQIKKDMDKSSVFLEKNYRDTKKYISKENGSCIAIDFNKHEICLGLSMPTGLMMSKTEEQKKAREHFLIYKFDQIVKAEIVSDGTSVISTNRGSQIAGAAIGGLALGGLGAAIGALTGSSTSHNKIKSLRLHIIIDDIENSTHDIVFMDWKYDNKGVNIDNHVAKKALDAVEEIYALIANAMRKVRNENEQIKGVNEKSNTIDKISKLWDLFKVGAITESEFNSQKLKLLDSTDGESIKY